MDNHPCAVVTNLMKLSFDDDHRQAMSHLGQVSSNTLSYFFIQSTDWIQSKLDDLNNYFTDKLRLIDKS